MTLFLVLYQSGLLSAYSHSVQVSVYNNGLFQFILLSIVYFVAVYVLYFLQVLTRNWVHLLMDLCSKFGSNASIFFSIEIINFFFPSVFPVSGHCAHDELPEEVNSILGEWAKEESKVGFIVNAVWILKIISTRIVCVSLLPSLMLPCWLMIASGNNPIARVWYI